MVNSSEFHMRRYIDEDHQEDVLHFSCRMGLELQQKIFQISFWTLGGAGCRV